jgi:hypothetical protein
MISTIEKQNPHSSGIIRKRIWTIEVIDYPGHKELVRKNDGFENYELVGLCEIIKQEILEGKNGN